MIRHATPEDARAIAQIWAPIVRDTDVTFTTEVKTDADVAQMIAARPCFLVYEESAQLLGFATFDQFRGGPGYAHTFEHTVIVAPEGQRRGVGRALISEVEARAKSHGGRSLIAGVSGTNVGALSFHRSIGFVEVGRVADAGRKFGRWIDLILLQKFI